MNTTLGTKHTLWLSLSSIEYLEQEKIRSAEADATRRTAEEKLRKMQRQLSEKEAECDEWKRRSEKAGEDAARASGKLNHKKKKSQFDVIYHSLFFNPKF